MAAEAMASSVSYSRAAAVRPEASVDEGNLPVILQAAMRQDMELSPAKERGEIIARVAALKARADAAAYLAEVSAKKDAAAERKAVTKGVMSP
jgi:hypothetical protein